MGAGGQHLVAWAAGTLMLERYRYPAGTAGSGERHAHEDVQLCLSLDLDGSYWHRGGWHPVPRGGLSVIGPGEVHSSRDLEDRPAPAHYLVVYAGAGQLTELAGRPGTPSFPLLVPDDELFRGFVALHRAYGRPASALERDGAALGVFGRLVRRHAHRPAHPRVPRAPGAVALAREHLLDNLAGEVTLAELARVANLSPFHLARAFSREVGLPPHAFQVQARVDRARQLLLHDRTVSRVAQDAGFYDESHLHRHFTRIVGVSPGQYRKHVQAARRGRS